MAGLWFRALSTLVSIPRRVIEALEATAWAWSPLGGPRDACPHRRCPRVWLGECPNLTDEDCLIRMRMNHEFREWMEERGMRDADQ